MKDFTIFWFLLVCRLYITSSKQFKPRKVPAVLVSIGVVGALARFTLFRIVYNLKVAQTNVQCSYEIEMGHKATVTTKNICGVEGEGAVDYRIVTISLKKIRSTI